MHSETRKSATPLLYWALGFSLLGLADSFWLLVLHLSPDSAGQVCSVGSSLNCSVLQLKQWSEWFGIPVAFVSGLFYVLVVFMSVASLLRRGQGQIQSAFYLWLLSWLALASTFYMAAVSVYLGILCPYCSVLYVVSVALFLLGLFALCRLGGKWRQLFRSELGVVHRKKWAYGLLLAYLSVLVPAGIFFPALEKAAPLVPEQHEIFSDELRSLGDKNAPVLVAVFSDFQCPFCKIAGGLVEELEAGLRGQVRVIYKFFPLDRACNRLGGGHPQSCQAAHAAYCASLQKRFWVYHDLIYANSRSLNEERFQEFAKMAGLDLEAFEKCMKDDRALKVIADDIEEGIALKLPGTPVMFINGQQYKGPLTVGALRQTIQNLL